jgi:3-hydroxyisobutyrate dehydrogenase-like beta-hydroxyacid dehydrogenase
MSNEKLKIGIVGLGIMGQGMANNFLKNGHDVFIWNRTTEISKDFETKGAVVCETPADVAGKVDILFEVTANDESSKAVWLGNDGILMGTTKETVLVASATLSLEWVDELIQKCKMAGLTFMDIALTGGRIGAETGALSLLCGGSESVLKKIEPALKSIASKIFHFGPEGHGMKYKLILNFVQAVHMVTFGQAMKIAHAYDMDLQKVSDALVDRPGGVITSIAQKAYFQEPDPITFSIEWITKDLAYAKKLAEGLDIKLLDEVLLEYKRALANGYSKKDWASVNLLGD